jgi:hypothetical protein
MKKLITFLVLLLLMQSINYAQTTTTLKKVMTLKINGVGGANGAGIVWHPKQKKYYAGMAGNETYPLCVFDAAGKLLSDETLSTMTDLRGMWFNSKLFTLQCNGFDYYGWQEYKLDNKGIPTELKILYEGRNQPDENSVGSYNVNANQVYFLTTENGLELSVYNMSDAKYNKTLKLHLRNNTSDESQDQPGLDGDYNNTTAIYNGLSNKEFVLLNITSGILEFYNLKGFMTASKKYPEGTVLEEKFNFAYANGIFWIFNKTDREWIGYK